MSLLYQKCQKVNTKSLKKEKRKNVFEKINGENL